MKRIRTQRESFSYRVAADNPFDPSDDRKKKYFDLGNAIPGVQKQQDLDALPQGHSAEPYEAAAAAVGPDAPGPRMPKMTVIPGAPSGGSAGGNTTGLPSGVGGSGGGSGGPARDYAHQKMMPYWESQGYTVGDHNADQYGEHQNGAVDVMVPNIDAGNKVLQQALSDPNVYGLIFNNQAYGYGNGANPSPYSAGNTGNPTQDHKDHVHIWYQPGRADNIAASGMK